MFKRVMEAALPAPLIHAARVILRKPGFYGDYPDFESASRDSSGYRDPAIAERVANRFRNWLTHKTPGPQAANIRAALDMAGARTVLDIGGASGEYHYMTGRDWTVLETPEMVRAHQGLNVPIRYVDTMPAERFDAVLLSGLIQCLPDPYAALREYSSKAEYIIVTRLPLIDRDRITVQRVDDRTSYPIWFLSKERFREAVGELGTILMEWPIPQDRCFLDGHRVTLCGMLVHITAPCLAR